MCIYIYIYIYIYLAPAIRLAAAAPSKILATHKYGFLCIHKPLFMKHNLQRVSHEIEDGAQAIRLAAAVSPPRPLRKAPQKRW